MKYELAWKLWAVEGKEFRERNYFGRGRRTPDESDVW
jgi:hypothetical protein